jgi:hypothetical protein
MNESPVPDPKTLGTKLKGAKGSRKQRAILALLQHLTQEKAAAAVGVHPVTLWRWQQEPAFQEELRQARRAVFMQSMGNLQQLCGAAVGLLAHMIQDNLAPAGSRVRAAETVVKLSQNVLEVSDILPRIDWLEARQREAEQPPKSGGAE